VRRGLSPPSQLRDAARRSLGLDVREILAAIEAHFDQHRRLYLSRSGDGFFYMVEASIRRAWEAKHPSRERADDEPTRPRPKGAGLRKVHNASDFPDVIVGAALLAWSTQARAISKALLAWSAMRTPGSRLATSATHDGESRGVLPSAGARDQGGDDPMTCRKPPSGRRDDDVPSLRSCPLGLCGIAHWD
jgi:hypothetical protein